jgi:hypothetical protein
MNKIHGGHKANEHERRKREKFNKIHPEGRKAYAKIKREKKQKRNRFIYRLLFSKEGIGRETFILW